MRQCNYEGDGGATLVYNSGTLGSVGDEITAQKEKLETEIEGMFGIIDGFGETEWSGASYNAFKTYCDNYKTNTIDPMLTELGEWASKFSKMSESASETSAAVSGIFE